MSPSLRLTVDIDINIDNEFEKDFMCWHDNCKRNGNEDDVRNALLTGYFIVSRGINEFYKRYYEHDFKAVCEAEQVDKLNGAKRDLDNARKEYEARLLNLQYEKEELEKRLYEYVERMKEQKAIVEREYMEYYRDKKQKEIDLVNLEKDKNIKDLEGQLGLLRRELDWHKSTRDDSVELEVRTLNDSKLALEKQVVYFRGLAEEKDEQLRLAFKNETQDKIAELEKVIYQKDAELKTLKSCNFVKGMTGENVIMGFLRERYPKHEVMHTGKVAHEGDIHFINNDLQTSLVVESKYKQSITKDDVEKFCRDVTGVSEKGGLLTCVGGVFVSLLTRNIPGKGDVCFEMLGNVPVMFVGFSSVDEFNVYFGRYFEMFNEMSRFWMSAFGEDNKQSSLEELMEELNFYFSMLVKNKSRIEDFKTNCLTKINKFIGDIETDNKVILDRVEGLLKKNNSMKHTSLKGGSVHGVHVCDKCGEKFEGKRILNKHLKTCVK
jgi:hypothetical protein